MVLICGTAGAFQSGKLDEGGSAIKRAMDFVYATAATDENLNAYGSDILWCFYSISHTSRDGWLRTSALEKGHSLAQRWRRLHRHVRADATAMDIYKMVEGAYAADRLGLPDPGFKGELRDAALRFTAKDYLGFDAPREPPRPDDPKRYDTYTDALIRTYFGDAYGIPMGAHYRDVVKWLPGFRPYQGDDDDIAFDSFYTSTHVIYTLNDYNQHRVLSALLPDEFAFLRRKLNDAIEDEDPEIVGEALDCLKAGGLEHDPAVKKGIQYLLSSQRADGAWAGDGDDIYTEYHSAWTGIDGLRDYRFRGKVTKLPRK